MAFSTQTLDFLTENRIVNSRDWFQENKPRYRALIEEPMLALSAALAPMMETIDPNMTLAPKRTLSRIWKDMRYSKDGALFRDTMWVTFRRGKGAEYPGYFFEFSPRSFCYGVGFFTASATAMQHIRRDVLADDRRYLAARAALDTLPHFALEGDLYKKPRHPDAPAHKRDWLERKNLFAISYGASMERLFSEDLNDVLARDFSVLAPLYRYFLSVHLETQNAGEEWTR